MGNILFKNKSNLSENELANLVVCESFEDKTSHWISQQVKDLWDPHDGNTEQFYDLCVYTINVKK